MRPDLLSMTNYCDILRCVTRAQAQAGSLLSLILLVMLVLPSFAMDVAPIPLPAVNQALPGSRAGILTKAQGTILQIDRATYTLAPIALVEDRFGTALALKDIQCNDVEYSVRYWVATDQRQNQIVQMIVSFPE
jgi:hypothetical protein